MPVVPTQEILERAFAERYGVAAINVVNDLTLEAVLAAAEELRAPLIVQTSVKTVRSIGADVLYAMWRAMTRDDRRPGRRCTSTTAPTATVISRCLARGWNSVLFDGSELTSRRTRARRIEVVAEARALRRRTSRARSRASSGVEDGDRLDEAAATVQSLETSRVEFIDATGVDCFAPAIGNAHGMYTDDAQARQPAGDRDRRGRPGSRWRCTAARA